jgi:hypothetical protein
MVTVDALSTVPPWDATGPLVDSLSAPVQSTDRCSTKRISDVGSTKSPANKILVGVLADAYAIDDALLSEPTIAINT